MPSAAVLAAAAQAPAAETAAADPVEIEPQLYEVKSGDTLYAIARRHGATVPQLQAWNKLRGTKLAIGDRLVVAAPRTANAQQQ
jgi:membrane-bound lytic murein transglycosylase D